MIKIRKDIMRVWNKIGGIYLLMDRGYRYVSLGNFLMILYLTFFKEPTNIIYPIILISGAFALTIFDYFYIYPKHVSKSWEKNPSYHKLLRRLDDLKESIEKNSGDRK